MVVILKMIQFQRTRQGIRKRRSADRKVYMSENERYETLTRVEAGQMVVTV